jgi:hypothetical protein
MRNDAELRQSDKREAVKELEDYRTKMRVEAAAIAIFAAMQANPNWSGSIDNQKQAVIAASLLIRELDRA